MADTEENAPATEASGSPRAIDLTSSVAIKQLYKTAYALEMKEHAHTEWFTGHVGILKDVQAASSQQIATPDFQERLWVDNPVSGAGADAISMKEVVRNRELAAWIGKIAKTPLPPRGPERISVLEKIYGELIERVKPLATRTPWLRILRVMATLFPQDYTNVTSEYRLQAVARAMFGRLSRDDREATTRLSARILDRLTEILGPADGSPEQLVNNRH